jgi:Na+-translocating ferredoxin:NAD+ oxidoreductase subunit B
MSADVYERLRARLDEMTVGFPSVESGAELRLLQQLFSVEEANTYLAMKHGYQYPAEVAETLGEDDATVAARMLTMSQKGLLFRIRGTHGQPNKYRVLPWLIGIMDVQVDHMTKKYLKESGDFFLNGLRKKTGIIKKLPMLRILPVNENLVAQNRILPIDDAISIINSKDRISVANCICRQTAQINGSSCSHPMETCLQSDTWADFFVGNGIARYITKEEAIEIVKKNEANGAVIEIMNSQDAEIICACCPCHCVVLALLRVTTDAGRRFVSNYTCGHDDAVCVNCGVCVKRCPIRARKMTEGKMEYKPDLCIGCGLCVSTCQVKANTLSRKAEDQIYIPDASIFDTYDKIEKMKKEG